MPCPELPDPNGERGAAVIEWVGALVAAMLIVGALLSAASGIGAQIAGGASSAVASVLGQGTTGAGGSGAQPAATPTPAGSGALPSGQSPPGQGPAGQAPTPGGTGAGSVNRGPQDKRLPSGGQRPYVPPKKGYGKPQRVRGGGFEDSNGNVWKWDPSGHAGPHWDVQHPDGSHTNVAPDGTVIGKDNFPNKAPAGGDGGSSAGDTAKKAAGGAAIVGTIGTILWWVAKGASPVCGPAAPICAIVF